MAPRTRRCRSGLSPIGMPVTMPILAALAVVGCGGGGDGVPREPVSGSVTLDGRPVERGQVTFIPEDGENVVSATIRDGGYALKRAEGPSPGRHRVTIWSQVPTGNKVVTDPTNPDELVDELRETIPERYNARSELSADVEPGGANRFDFELSTAGAGR